MDIENVRKSYARWALCYDWTFGAATQKTRKNTVEYIASQGRRVLEIGVGTGMSLAYYPAGVQVTGIDYSHEMLAKARRKVAEKRLNQVEMLRQMDARELDFPDDSFDAVAAIHVLSVVPEPERVVSEMARVCRPGGKVVITNHFARKTGALARVERVTAPFAGQIGWHSDFEMNRVMGEGSLELMETRQMPPMGMMTFLSFRKRGE